jgi:hypothetical protein
MQYRFKAIFTWGEYEQAADDASQHDQLNAWSDILLLTEGEKWRDLQRIGLIGPDEEIWVGIWDDPELASGEFARNGEKKPLTIPEGMEVHSIRPFYYRSRAIGLQLDSGSVEDEGIIGYNIGYELLLLQFGQPVVFTRTERVDLDASTKSA